MTIARQQEISYSTRKSIDSINNDIINPSYYNDDGDT
jgi:hypothetical protein